jgi:chemotaxis protein CheX
MWPDGGNARRKLIDMSAAQKSNFYKLSFDDTVVRIIDNAIQETFSSFLGIQPILVNSEIGDAPLREFYEISGIIAFVQDSIEATLAIRFRQAVVIELLSKIYSEDLTSVNSKVIGGVAELSNVIHGISKEYLNLLGFNFQMSLPVVIVGDNNAIATIQPGPRLILNYDIGGFPMFVELILQA